MNLNNSAKNILISAAVLNVAAFSVFAFLLFSVWRAEGKTEALILEISKAKKTERAAQSAKELLANTEEKRLLLNSYFIKDGEVVEFIEDAERMGKDLGLLMKTENISESAPNPAISEKIGSINFKIEAEGSWGRIYQSLSLLELMPVKSEIKSFILERIDKPESSSDKKKGLSLWRGSFDMDIAKINK